MLKLSEKSMPELVQVFRRVHGRETAKQYAAELYRLFHPDDTLTCGSCVYGIPDTNGKVLCTMDANAELLDTTSPCWGRNGVKR